MKTPPTLVLLALLLTLTLTHAQLDRTCTANLLNRGACCPSACGQCGGSQCAVNTRRTGMQCCPNAILRSNRVCTSVAPPCKLAGASATSNRPDPMCRSGRRMGGVCCPRACITCGGARCAQIGMRLRSTCCAPVITASNRFCASTGAPCRLAASSSSNPAPPPPPMPAPAPAPNNRVSTLNGAWDIAPVSSGELVRRHEACAVMVRGLVVLLGGRGLNKRVSVYNPATRVWQRRDGPGANVQIHHFQCVATDDGKVWIPTSWTGGFPFEDNNRVIYVYDVVNDVWSTRPGLPEPRRRGGAAAVLRGNKIYVVGGNRGGHGGHAQTLGWMDMYDISTNRWTTNLPELPVGRDHVGAALVRGRLCVAGGRDGGARNFPFTPFASSFCFNFNTNRWTRVEDFPDPRAGAMTGTTCDGNMMIAGGEGFGQAFARVDVFNGSVWRRAPNLRDSRHGSGLAVADCSCGQIFIPSGSGNQGGSPELLTTERYIPRGRPARCQRY